MNKLFKSFGFALKGIKISLHQRNFKIQLTYALLAICLGVFFGITSSEWCAILVCCSLVLSLEAINTAIEHLVNFVSPEFNPKAGIIKDISAGAVLISAIISVVIGFIIYTKYVLALLNI